MWDKQQKAKCLNIHTLIQTITCGEMNFILEGWLKANFFFFSFLCSLMSGGCLDSWEKVVVLNFLCIYFFLLVVSLFVFYFFFVVFIFISLMIVLHFSSYNLTFIPQKKKRKKRRSSTTQSNIYQTTPQRRKAIITF